MLTRYIHKFFGCPKTKKFSERPTERNGDLFKNFDVSIPSMSHPPQDLFAYIGKQ